MDISRKHFIETLAGGSALLLLGSCGGGGYGGGGVMQTSSCTPTIAVNHGHVLVVAVADLNSTTDKTYDIMGSATHTHQVTFTVAQLGDLKAGRMVTVTSTAGDVPPNTHTHSVSVSCLIYP